MPSTVLGLLVVSLAGCTSLIGIALGGAAALTIMGSRAGSSDGGGVNRSELV